MSIRVMTAVFDHSEARGSDRLVLLVIADRSDDDGAGCYRGKESIARMARVSRATVTRSIANLVALGELEVDHRAGQSSNYRIIVHPAQSEPTPQSDPAQSEPPTRLTREPPPGSTGSRDTSITILDPSARANALTREWWENYQRAHDGRDPMQPFIAARGIVLKAVKAKWTDEQIRWSLPRAGVPLVTFKLLQVLERASTSGVLDYTSTSKKRGIG